MLPSADIERITPLGEGWACVVYRLPDASGDWALSVTRPDPVFDDGAARTFSPASDLRKEMALLPALQAYGLPVAGEARLIETEDGRVLGGVERVVGGVAARRVQPRGRARRRLAAEIGAFLTRLHSFPREQAIALGVPEVDVWDEQYEPLIRAALRQLKPRSANWVEARVQRFLDEGGMTGRASTLVHDDLSGDHIYAREDGSLSGVIDFADAVIGDPAADFFGMTWDFSRPFLRRVFDHYGGPADEGFWRRIDFYDDMAGLFSLHLAAAIGRPQSRMRAIRRFAARAGAATRRGVDRPR